MGGMSDGPGGEIENVPAELLQAYQSAPTAENRATVRAIFEKLESKIVEHFGEEYARNLAKQLGIEE